MSDNRMSKTERVELTQLIRKRERVMKSQAFEQGAIMLAHFDEQLATIYEFDQDEAWNGATEIAQKAVDESNAQIAKRCRDLGIPPEFAPRLEFGWCGRGQNAVAGRRSELRRMAASKIKAITEATKSRIERMSLEAQTQVVANGLESAAAKNFLETMPGVDELMGKLDARQLQKEMEAERDKRRRLY